MVTTSSRASSNAFGGGTNVLASYNRKFEKVHAIIPNLSFSQTKIDSTVKTTNIQPVDDNVGTFASYTQSDYEKTFLNEDFFFINQKLLHQLSTNLLIILKDLLHINLIFQVQLIIYLH